MIHLTAFMHKAVRGLETAIRGDDSLKSILAANPGTEADVGAAIVHAVLLRAEHPVTVAPGVRIDPTQPDPKQYHKAVQALAELAYKENDSLLYFVGRSARIIGHRQGCRTSPATVLLGYIDANERNGSKRLPHRPSPDARTLAARVHAHPDVRGFRLGTPTIYRPNKRNAEPYVLGPEEFAR